MTSAYDQQRVNMIEGLLRPQGIVNEEILSGIVYVKRESFLPADYHSLACAECAIPLPTGTHTLTPLMEAKIVSIMLEGRSAPMDQMLLVGAGSGYLAALLSQYTRHLCVVDHQESDIRYATDCLRQALISNVVLKTCSDWLHCTERAPYDAVVVTYLLHAAPSHLLEQLKVGGRLLFVQGQPGSIAQVMLCVCQKEKTYTCTPLFETTWDRFRVSDDRVDSFVF